jgi:acyl transferase domain-containing protein
MDSLNERLRNMTPLQRAVLALKETQARLDALECKRTEPIAIVGMACRFPGRANDAASYWRLLCEGVDAVSEIPPGRWNVADFYDPDPASPGKMTSRWGGFLERIDEFDNRFFGISDFEAAHIDPQHRMLLELAWEALEDAGLPPAKLRGAKIGVFIGISVSEYGLMLSTDVAQTNAYAVAGTSLCLAANRLSFAYGLKGPSMALDTACSSSLVAIHLACQQIRSGECDGALVGGANLLLSPIGTINLTKAGFCAADGRVRAFDAAAAGYVRSEGAGLVMLKPLSEALKNKDPIYAVIRGSAVNQNGSSNGMTAPSRAAQEEVLREAYQRAHVSPGQVDFVETQGTGTRLGDVIEATALGNVLRQDRPAGRRCSLGAVKTNIGHMESASGVASLMKAALALKHQALPPNLNFETPNPEIPFDTLLLQVPRSLVPWPRSTQPRFAGVSAFGFGGSNAHVVLAEPPAEPSDAVETTSTAEVATSDLTLLPLSARTESALRDLATRYVEFLANDATPPWSDVCYTAAQRRQHHDCRLAVLAASSQRARDQLKSFLNDQSPTDFFAGRKPFGRELKVAFIFSDQVQLWQPLMARLADVAPGLTAAAAEIDTACERVLGWLPTMVNGDNARWSDPAWSKSALLVLQLRLSEWWRSLGITPDVVVGRGVGELAAAAVAGILSTEEALQLVSTSHRTNGSSVCEMSQPRAATFPFFSTVDGKRHIGTDLDAAHWQACLGSAYSMAAVVPALAERQVDVYVEMGPAALDVGVRQLLAASSPSGYVLPSLFVEENGSTNALTAVGTLYALGADLRWEPLGPANPRFVRVPSYPWQRQRLWAPTKKFFAERTPQTDSQPAPVAIVCSRPALTAPYVEPRTKLQAAMVQVWGTILRIEGIGIHDNFFELGGDSLQATILLNTLQQQLGETIPAHALFQVQTINDLAEYLCQYCADAVRRQFPEEVSESPLTSNGEPVTTNDRNMNGAGSIPRLARAQEVEELLARLDELADDEVEILLGKAIADGEANA